MVKSFVGEMDSKVANLETDSRTQESQKMLGFHTLNKKKGVYKYGQ